MAAISSERAKLERALLLARELKRRNPWQPLPGPQTAGFESKADIVGLGGAAGGGKTDFIVGTAIMKHQRVLILRREKAQTEGIIQRLGEIAGGTAGFNSQKSIWRVPVGKEPLIEFGGLDNVGDEARWQGRPHDLKCYDEVTEQRESQVRFTMGWTRTSDPKQQCQVLMTFNPPTTSEGRWVIKFFAPWLDKTHPNPAAPGELRWFTTIGENLDYEVPDSRPFVLSESNELIYDFNPRDYKPEQIIKPKSRTFIPARVTDNKYYMQSGYMSQLQALPEPLRSQMLYGDFQAGVSDDPWQVIPTAWIEAAMARWRPRLPKPEMDSIGVDVARGGKDKTVLAPRHGMWFDHLIRHPGKDTPDGPVVAGLVIGAMRDRAVIHIDVIGVGASPYDFLVQAQQQVVGVNVSEKAQGTDKSGRLRFFNQRSEMAWRMREALDPTNNTGIELPPDDNLKSDLCALTWTLSGSTIKVDSREDIIDKIGRSPDDASAVLLALKDTPKIDFVKSLGTAKKREHDPYANV